MTRFRALVLTLNLAVGLTVALPAASWAGPPGAGGKPRPNSVGSSGSKAGHASSPGKGTGGNRDSVSSSGSRPSNASGSSRSGGGGGAVRSRAGSKPGRYVRTAPAAIRNEARAPGRQRHSVSRHDPEIGKATKAQPKPPTPGSPRASASYVNLNLSARRNVSDIMARGSRSDVRATDATATRIQSMAYTSARSVRASTSSQYLSHECCHVLQQVSSPRGN